MPETLDYQPTPKKRRYDRVYIAYKGLSYVADYPLCEILDGRIEEVGSRVIKMRLQNGSTVVYEFTQFIETIDRALNENKKIVGMAIQREGYTTKERIL
jgi:hypothetical protein